MLNCLWWEKVSVYLGYPSETYSFFNIDSIFDFLLSIGMKPIVELSFMPEALARGNSTIFHYKGNINPPKNWNAWAYLVQNFTKVITSYFFFSNN